MSDRVEGSATKQRFALQLYSRLTNANPELVLVFMQAGSVGAKQASLSGADSGSFRDTSISRGREAAVLKESH